MINSNTSNPTTGMWDNYIMRKYGRGIRKNILSSYLNGFARASTISAVHKAKNKREFDKLLKDISKDA